MDQSTHLKGQAACSKKIRHIGRQAIAASGVMMLMALLVLAQGMPPMMTMDEDGNLDLAGQGFASANYKAAINGYVFGNLPMP